MDLLEKIDLILIDEGDDGEQASFAAKNLTAINKKRKKARKEPSGSDTIYDIYKPS